MKTVSVDTITLGKGKPFVLIAGPCVIESEEHSLAMAGQISEIAGKLGIGYIFKSSFDKANRSSIDSPRGPGLEKGLQILRKVKERHHIPVLTDIHEPSQAAPAAEVADVLQIPAFLCRQTDLLIAAAKTGKVVNVKKGQFMAPQEMKNAVHKLESSGAAKILLTERGTFFGYHRLVNDFTGIPQMQELGYPVIFDATHSVQSPGGGGTVTSGNREMIPLLTRAAVAVGVEGIFMEVHDNPDSGLSDAANMFPLNKLEELLNILIQIDHIVKER